MHVDVRLRAIQPTRIHLRAPVIPSALASVIVVVDGRTSAAFPAPAAPPAARIVARRGSPPLSPVIIIGWSPRGCFARGNAGQQIRVNITIRIELEQEGRWGGDGFAPRRRGIMHAMKSHTISIVELPPSVEAVSYPRRPHDWARSRCCCWSHCPPAASAPPSLPPPPLPPEG